jgi:glycosyltransferase involved in cell wall biosynthesis
MKICMLVTSNIVRDPRVLKEARLAFDKGNQVTVIGRKDSNIVQNNLYNFKMIFINADYAKDKNKIIHLMKIIYLRTEMIIKCLSEKPDIIHANDLDTMPSAYIASKLLKCKLVYDSHEIYTENIGLQNKKILKIILKKVEKFLIQRSDNVISVSNAASQELSIMYNILPPIVITNCPFSFKIPKMRNLDENFEVLYHGLMLPDRGYEEFVESAQFINDEICLVLRGYGSILHNLKNISKNKKITNKVRFDEPVTVEELIPLAAKSQVGVVLTKPVNNNFKYTVSNKIFEYINAGIPVIMSDVPEHRYLNNKYNFGIILDEVTPINIAEAIMRLRNNHVLYTELKENAISASKYLCWEVEGEKLINLYLSLIQK